MYLKVKSKYAPEGEFEFFWSGLYVYMTTDEKPGTLGDQICYGGKFLGDTVMADSEGQFRKCVKNWMAEYRIKNKSGKNPGNGT